jgi:hypothetical protein
MKYGNSLYWCFLPEGFDAKEVAIWKGPVDNEQIICRAVDKYEAKQIVDALLSLKNNDVGSLGKKEMYFLEFVKSTCPEPYATRASNSILWSDHTEYKNLLSQFTTIYS